MPEWEQASAIAVYKQIAGFIDTTGGATSNLTEEQRGRFVALCWIGQIYKHIANPKPSYVADWDELPEWQQRVDAAIFDAVEASLTTTSSH
ncbi:hypothetical protein [Nocardia sp. NPDC004604]|uniref:hypothetical protein n=1 Tax=Nocardia sp. NPDC004604 TaxID=3157013 RepID=UPI0033B7C17C